MTNSNVSAAVVFLMKQSEVIRANRNVLYCEKWFNLQCSEYFALLMLFISMIS